MANILQFQGVCYNPQQVDHIGNVVAPPYDVIGQDAQAALYARHPHNVIRLELGQDHAGDDSTRNKYTRAAESLRTWLHQGILARDLLPGIYPFTIQYHPPSWEHRASTKTLKGFMALLELEEFGEGTILPHENTRNAAKHDRLNLLEACQANFSPIVSLYSDLEGTAAKILDTAMNMAKPRFEFQDDEECVQRVWALSDQHLIQELRNTLHPQPLFIADGHHRYETALTYRNARRQHLGIDATRSDGHLHPWESVLMLFASLEDPGLTVLPTHRILKTALPSKADLCRTLTPTFEIEEFPFQAHTEGVTRQKLLQALQTKGQHGHAFGVALRNHPEYLLLTLRPEHAPKTGESPVEKLDVSILHAFVMNPLVPRELTEDTLLYSKNEQASLDMVRQGMAEGALLLNPTKVQEVRDVASAGERMPHKSTYFFPKPLTGLVMNVMSEAGG